MKSAALAALLVLCFNALRAEDAAPLSLAGTWAGRWTDSRPEYSKSGGDFSCVAVAKFENVWTCTFKLGKTRQWIVELKGTLKEGKLVFGGAVDLGAAQGMYTWSGTLSAEGFKGDYDGPDEKGTFAMKRVEAKSK